MSVHLSICMSIYRYISGGGHAPVHGGGDQAGARHQPIMPCALYALCVIGHALVHCGGDQAGARHQPGHAGHSLQLAGARGLQRPGMYADICIDICVSDMNTDICMYICVSDMNTDRSIDRSIECLTPLGDLCMHTHIYNMNAYMTRHRGSA